MGRFVLGSVGGWVDSLGTRGCGLVVFPSWGTDCGSFSSSSDVEVVPFCVSALLSGVLPESLWELLDVLAVEAVVLLDLVFRASF